MNTIKLPGLFALALLSAAAFAAAPARADDDGATQDESASQQLQDNDHSGQDAVQAPTDESAKDLSNQGWDTPNNDPAPPADNSGN
ncbi:MAG TPA: hypothetical protein VGT78_07395 [Rhizomicrobium sp.]|nr:hypothetical protein [Rhizomicrobium sp.]